MDNIPAVKFHAGEAIFKEGDLSNSVYLIIDGEVEISKQRNRKKFVLDTQGKNTMFGEMALVDGKPRSATVIAIKPTICYKCAAYIILEELRKVDAEVRKAMQNFAAIIRENNNLKLVDNRLEAASNKDIIFDECVKEPYVTKEEILGNVELQEKIERLSPFIKSMYRVLMQIAYK